LHLLVSGSTTLRLVYFGFPGELVSLWWLTGSARVVMLHLFRCIRAACLTSLLRAEVKETACGIRTRASRMAPSCSSAETKAAKLPTNERVGRLSAPASVAPHCWGLRAGSRIGGMREATWAAGFRPLWFPEAPSCQRSCSASPRASPHALRKIGATGSRTRDSTVRGSRDPASPWPQDLCPPEYLRPKRGGRSPSNRVGVWGAQPPINGVTGNCTRTSALPEQRDPVSL
jgi:hypothetical protein